MVLPALRGTPLPAYNPMHCASLPRSPCPLPTLTAPPPPQTLLDACSVQIFFVDTSPFIERYQTAPWAHCAGGVLQQSWQEQLAELEGHLAASTASWKLVVGHHPPRSNGEHGNNTELMLHLEPLLLQYGVQVLRVWFLREGGVQSNRCTRGLRRRPSLALPPPLMPPVGLLFGP